MFKSIGPMELILILVIIFIFFGVGKLPQVGDAMGKAIRAFKKAQNGEDEEPAAVAPATTEKTSAKKITKTSKSTKKTA
ncbi:MAG: twin-arginine translocase TatA/TatE family subunit [Dehalococcoidales bacterium]|nr:twin-arginine translocase TatA/TatE family subunit [Dehalococcoidales bacterium]